MKVGTKYQAFVRARNASGEQSEWSAPLVFEVTGAQNPGRPFPAEPVLNPPPLNRFDQTPTISWSPINGAIGYDVMLYNKDAGKLVTNMQAQSGESFTPSSPLPGGNYQIFVRAVAIDGRSGIWSLATEFRVTVQVAEPVPPSIPPAPPTGPIALLDTVFAVL